MSNASSNRTDILCVGLFALLAIVLTLPLAIHANNSIPAGGDSWMYYWDIWWIKRSVVELRTNPFFSSFVHFPYGANLYFHTLNFLPSAAAIPIAFVFGIPAAYDAILIFELTFSAFASYQLARYVIAADEEATSLAAIVGAVTFAFNGYHFAHVFGHLDLLSTGLLAFVALYTLKSEEAGWRSPAICAAFLVTTFFTSLYYFMFACTFIAVRCAWTLREQRAQALPILRRIAGAFAIFVVVASPVLVPMLFVGRTAGRTPNPAYDAQRFSADLASFVVPSYLHPIWGRFVDAFYRAVDPNRGGIESVAFLGFVCLTLSLFGLRRSWSAGRFWLFGALLYGWLALGPMPHVLGFPLPQLSVVMPYRYLSLLPYGDIPRVPARFAVMASLCLSVTAALGASTILRRTRRAASVAGVFVAIAILENIVAPIRVMSVAAPLFYAQLASQPDGSAIVEVPIPDDPARFPRRMLFQTIHQHPVYGGYLARGLPPLRFEAIPGFAQFKNLSPLLDDIVSYSAADVDASSVPILNVYGAGHIVIDKKSMTDVDVAASRSIAERMLHRTPEFEDESTLAFLVPRSSEVQRNVLWLDTGWSYLERSDSAGVPEQWRWMGDSARLGILARGSARARILFGARALRRSRRVSFALETTTIGSVVVSPDVGQYASDWFDVTRPATFLEIKSVEGSETALPDSRPLSVAFFNIRLETAVY